MWRLIRLGLGVCLGLSISLVLLAGAAFAQDAGLTITVPDPTTVDFTPLLDAVLQALAGVLVAVGIWAVTRLAKKFGLDLDEGHRRAIYKAMDSGMNTAVEFARQKGQDLAQVEVRNDLVRMAAALVVARTPGAVKHFKLSREGVEDRVMALLGEKLPDLNGPAPGRK